MQSSVTSNPKSKNEVLLSYKLKKKRRAPTDWIVELHRLDSSRFPHGFEDLRKMDGASAPVPSGFAPLDAGFVRGNLDSAKLDYLGWAVNYVFEQGLSAVAAGGGVRSWNANQFCDFSLTKRDLRNACVQREPVLWIWFAGGGS